MIMKRRQLLASTGLAMGGLSGCTNLSSVGLNENTKIGESQSYEGVLVTPEHYITAQEVTLQLANNQKKVAAESGASILLTKLNISHEGDSEQEFPTTSAQDTIDLYYDDDRVEEGGMLVQSAKGLKVGDKKLVPYSTALYEADATGEYIRTEVSGWLFNEVASNFSPTDLFLHIVWNMQIVGDEGETVQKWQYTDDAEISIDQVEEEESTIVL